jgi:hypothetical protein
MASTGTLPWSVWIGVPEAKQSGKQRQKQIRFGNDSKKGKNSGEADPSLRSG